MKPAYFPSAPDFCAWLETNHASAAELTVVLGTKFSGRGGPSYAEALDEALCFGWIDGLRGKLDAGRYTIRFTPRQRGSIWSRVNVRHFERLRAAGRVHAAGLAAFAARDPKKTGSYSFERRPENFPPALEKTFRAAKRAWAFWSAQPAGYRRTATWWVVSAKQESTRQRRLATLIADSAAGRRLAMLAR